MDIQVLRDALNACHHDLNWLHGTWVTDRPNLHPEVTWQIDKSGTLEKIERALEALNEDA